MKTISDYSIYCTPEQTRKAIELGAPIKYKEVTDHEGHLLDYEIIDIPTAEQMRGWLMKKLNATTFHTTYYPVKGRYGYLIICNIECEIDNGKYLLPSDKEATLSAIDAALGYLEKQV